MAAFVVEFRQAPATLEQLLMTVRQCRVGKPQDRFLGCCASCVALPVAPSHRLNPECEPQHEPGVTHRIDRSGRCFAILDRALLSGLPGRIHVVAVSGGIERLIERCARQNPQSRAPPSSPAIHLSSRSNSAGATITSATYRALSATGEVPPAFDGRWTDHVPTPRLARFRGLARGSSSRCIGTPPQLCNVS